MKKISFIIISILFLLISIFIIIKLSQQENNLVFTTFKKSYSFVSEITEEEEIIVLINFSKKNSFLSKQELINSCYISDKNEDNKRQLILNGIEYYREIEIKDKKYYEYKFSFKFSLEPSFEDNFIIEDAYLIINLIDEKPIKINIGDFNYYKVNKIQDNQNMRISKIKGIINIVNERKRVVGLNIKIENKTNEKLKLKSINIFNNNINGDGSKIKILENEIDHNINISELIHNYNFLDNDSEITNLEISGNSNVDLFIPIVYQKDIVANEFGFSLSYEINSISYDLNYDDFIFFENINYEEKQLQNLNFYYYENN